MSIDIFETRKMLEAVEQIPRPRTFLLDTFFKGSAQTETAYVDIDIIKGKRRMAPFVSPNMPGKVVDRTGYVTRSYKPPYVKPKMQTKAGDLMMRPAGSPIYSNAETLAVRAARQLGKDLAELDGMITRREEWMAAQALNGGTITVVGDGVNDTIDFLMLGTHKVTLTGAALWTDSSSNPINDLIDWSQLTGKDSGLVPTHAIFGLNAWKAFSNHDKIKGKYNMLKVNIGQIQPQQLPNGVTFCGSINEAGVSLDLYTYSEWYVDDGGTEQPMVPADKLWLGSSNAANTKLYGAIQDMEAQNNFAVARYPKSWTEKDPGVRWIMVQSAPLMALNQPDAFMSCKVV